MTLGNYFNRSDRYVDLLENYVDLSDITLTRRCHLGAITRYKYKQDIKLLVVTIFFGTSSQINDKST